MAPGLLRCPLKPLRRLDEMDDRIPAQILMLLSAGIILALGTIHLAYTFRGSKLTPRDPALQVAMDHTSPVITRETTMWRCWVGFNASHSMGAILFGLVYGFLAATHAQLLFHSIFLLVVGLAMLGGFLVLGRVYWFSVPFRSIAVALACYLAGIAVALT
jgi:hypothetical protein